MQKVCQCLLSTGTFVIDDDASQMLSVAPSVRVFFWMFCLNYFLH